ncbi:transmembrane protein, putative (macronuclear) [Tetrahymena thermophila SB210]|uniref:Transmembrane protein, putative n=1 Tax=Tetrahymena thermophila (strain SB210) TaxID=312017 RepID=Q239L9_TETTS|nr:transmembrane protein, putative [Tetrahymena thermophila SB210]EAR93210.2 transmembrane protein, putative [Tetrahymena thermophila SB210]|eukprot:XP_001013455.2 transmembrane protein, putative [Tetrahymena thermophila SB210]
MLKSDQNIIKRIRNIFYNDLLIERALVLFLFLFLYSIYDLLSFIVLSIFLISIYITFSKEIKKFKHKGLIYYLSSSLQNLLIKSSFFDLFTLFWNPYLKIFQKPFFYNISPEEAVKTLDELPDEAKNVILTKGIVYSLPPFMKQVLLPQQIYKEICQREEEEKNEIQNQQNVLMVKNCDNTDNCQCENCANEESKDPNNKWGVVNQKRNNANRYNSNQHFYKNVIEEEDLLHLTEVKQDQFYKISQKSTLNFHKNFEAGNYENQNSSSIIQTLNNRSDKFKNEEKRIKDRVESIRKIMMEQPLEIKTKLIASSQDQSQNMLQNKRESNSNQINIEEGIQNMIEGLKKKFNGSSNDSAIGQIKSAVNLLLGVAEMKKKSNILQKIETTKMYKYFVFSAVFLLSQYFISKKTRRWLISSTMLVAYVVSFFLTFGSIGIYIYKNVNQPEDNTNTTDFQQSKRKIKKKLNKSTLEDSKYLMDDSEF